MFDVAVVGTGPAASSYAALMASAGASTAIIGRRRPHPAGTLELVSARAANVLATLRIDMVAVPDVEPLRATTFAWGRQDAASRSPSGRWGGGWIVDRNLFDDLLLERALAAGAVLQPTTVATMAHERTHSRLTDPSGAHIDARAVAIATGRTGRVGLRAGLRRVVQHRMVAITRWFPARAFALGRMLVQADACGWWYAMGTGRGTVVAFVTDVDLMRAGPDRAHATWSWAAEGVEWLPTATDEPLFLRAATVSYAPTNPLAPRARALIPLGDAALAADPLSGHGLVLALEGAARAAKDPGTYPDWLDRAQRAHREREQSLYATETRYADSPFWSRRLADQTAR